MSLQKLGALITITLCCVLLIWYALPTTTKHLQVEQGRDERLPTEYLRDKSMKSILMWNNFFEYKHMGFDNVGHKIFEEFQCQVTNCYVWDYLDGEPPIPVEEFDLIWYHGMDIPKGTLLRNKPAIRKPHQIYFFFLMESPSRFAFDLIPLNGFFNWTGTYRRDSDIYRPYGKLTEKIINTKYYAAADKSPVWIAPDYTALESPSVPKKKLAAWVVSNCVKIPSNRDIYVEELSQYIDIDIFGACGKPCGEQCTDEMMEKNYKFYLAFENSMCEDYITEKFFRTLKMDVVPIVFGGADYAMVAPPMSYIDTRDYETPKDLAVHLKFLDSNQEEYNKYFWWKRYYHVNSTNVLCEMCEKLNQPEINHQVIDDLEGWWNGPGVCSNDTSADLSTWVKRALKSPVQTIEYGFVLMITNTNYAVLLFVFMSLIVIAYCITILCIQMCIKRTIRRKSEIRYESLTKVL